MYPGNRRDPETRFNVVARVPDDSPSNVRRARKTILHSSLGSKKPCNRFSDSGTKLCTRKKKTVNGVKRFSKRICIFLLLRVSSDSSNPVARFNVRLVKFKHLPIVVVRRRRSFGSWRLWRSFDRIPTTSSSTDEDKSYGMNLTRGPSRSKAKATIKFNHRARSII